VTVIKSIKFKGFKSFAKPIEILFNNDFNSVIGPNGSGKSNIIDGLCFVLGRLSAKSMRAEKSANMIYNGGKEGQPAKYAEVAITFDNSSKVFPVNSDEVKITRIVKENGQSRYMINEDIVTRQQVLDLLAHAKINPDGHNIVLQGDIVHMAEMAAEERRKVIEEIAGISVYEEKKEKAISELQKVDAKLSEAEIILTERETYLKELKKDRDQALKYKELEKNIKRNKATYLHIQISSKEDKKQEHKKRIEEQNKHIEDVNSKINSANEELQKNKEELKQINISIEEKGEKEQIQIQKDIEEIKTKTASMTTRSESLDNEIKRIEQRKKQLLKNIEETKQKINFLNQEKKKLLDSVESLKEGEKKTIQEIENFKKKHGFSNNLETEIGKIDKEIDSLQNDILNIQTKKQELESKKAILELKIEDFKKKINELGSDKEAIKSLKDLRKDFEIKTRELNKLIDEDSYIATQMSGCRTKIFSLQEKHAQLNSQQASFKQQISSNMVLTKINNLKHSINGIYGLVSELGKVDKDFSKALSIAAGPKMNSIIVEDDAVASKCIEYLKQNKLGTASFIPLNKIKSPQINSKLSSQGLGLAIHKVQFEPRFKKAFEYIFSNTIVVKDVNSARKIGIGDLRMVTLDGDLIEQSGVMTGGFRRKGSYAEFNEKETDSKIAEYDTEINTLNNSISTLQRRRNEVETTLQKLRTEKIELETKILKIEKMLGNEKDIENLIKETSQNENEINNINEEIKKILENIQKIKEIVIKKKEEKENLRLKSTKPEVVSNLNSLEEERKTLRENIIQYTAEAKNFDSQIKTILEPELINIEKILKQHDKEIQDFKLEMETIEKGLKEQSSSLKDKENAEKSFRSNFKKLFVLRNNLSEKIQKQEININNLQNKIREVETRINGISLDKAKVTAELEGLYKEFESYKETQLRKGIEFNDLKDEIYKFEKMLKDLGNINMRALEIYDEIEQEYNKVVSKVGKLKTEKEDVMIMMEEIESNKTSLFMKTFHGISKNFENIFSQLTTKGIAHLELENKEKPLEGGIFIKVRITSNKFLDIKSLSGGEKTLTALAFIFSIQEHEPCSFYIFDEVDAALDKRNSEKLAKLVKKYSEKAQYIIISHNDAMIAEATQIYGVSMVENGMSKVVSLRV